MHRAARHSCHASSPAPAGEPLLPLRQPPCYCRPHTLPASLLLTSPAPQLVRDLLQKGKANGFNVMRTWAHTVNPQFALQVRQLGCRMNADAGCVCSLMLGPACLLGTCSPLSTITPRA